LGEANAKWIIKNNPDGVTTDVEIKAVAREEEQIMDFFASKTSRLMGVFCLMEQSLCIMEGL
jgi:hypothetical protein